MGKYVRSSRFISRENWIRKLNHAIDDAFAGKLRRPTLKELEAQHRRIRSWNAAPAPADPSTFRLLP